MTIYVPKITAPKHGKETLLKFKSHIKPHTNSRNFNTPFSPMDKSIRQKLTREKRELTELMNQMDLKDIYTTFHPNTEEYTLFSAPHDHILSNKANPHRYR